MSPSNFFLLNDTFKLNLQYLFNLFVLFNIVYYIKPNFKLKIDPKMCTFKYLEEIWKTWKNFEKASGNPDNNFASIQNILQL